MGNDKIKSTTIDLERSIGRQVRKYRKNLCISQERLAELVNLSTTSISRLENGKQLVSVSKLIQIACALEINIGDLFCTVNYPKDKNGADVDAKIAKILNDCSINEKEYLLENMKLVFEYFTTY